MKFALTLLALLIAADLQAALRRRRPTQETYSPVSVAPVAGSASAVDALSEVNAARAARGLAPYIHDEGLAQAARSAAEYRAARGIRGHTQNDFSHLPAGSSASAAGCGGLEAAFGWAACCTFDRYTYAGAATVYVGNIRFNHIFVR